MVMVLVPVDALEPTFTVIVDVPLPGALMEVGLKVTEFELPSPDADKAIAELKPPATVVVTV
jgi:2-keto-3-deoxy-6-phosphogluconate aldolase